MAKEGETCVNCGAVIRYVRAALPQMSTTVTNSIGHLVCECPPLQRPVGPSDPTED
jgi:hypothetical protein